MSQSMSQPITLHTVVTGSGLPVILSHGVGGDTTVWTGLAARLGERFQVVSWDQPGHGNSARVSDDQYGPGLAYRSLSQVAEAFDKVILVGHSLGGYLSARYAIDNPSRVAALGLIATGPGFRSPDARDKWNRDVTRGAEKQGRPETLVGLHEDSYVMDHLAEIACPSIVMVGAHDAAFVGATDYIERKVPGIERVTIADADHMVPSTHADAIADLLLDFLARRGIA